MPYRYSPRTMTGMAMSRLAKDRFDPRFSLCPLKVPSYPKSHLVLGFNLLEFFCNDTVNFRSFPAQVPEFAEARHPGLAAAVVRPKFFRQGLGDKRPERNSVRQPRTWRSGRWSREFRELSSHFLCSHMGQRQFSPPGEAGEKNQDTIATSDWRVENRTIVGFISQKPRNLYGATL